MEMIPINQIDKIKQEAQDDFLSRVGKFEISTRMIRLEPQIVKMLLGKVLITRAEELFHSRTIEYIGCCQDFDMIEDGYKIPKYDSVVTKIDDSNYNLTFKKTGY